MTKKIHIGTSGWSYDWDNFYKNTAKGKQLGFYSSQFETVEVNYSFYRLPRRSTLKKWREETPDGFLFSAKLSRYITHIKRLKSSKTAFRKFLRRVSVLKEKLGPILVQLPPNFKVDTERLDKFLKDIKGNMSSKTPFRLAIEPRNESWFKKESLDILKKHNTALVFSDGEKFPYPVDEPITTNFVYIRLHGPAKIYDSKYKEKDLEKWRDKIKRWRDKNLEVYVYFDNDAHGYAPENAFKLVGCL